MRANTKKMALFAFSVGSRYNVLKNIFGGHQMRNKSFQNYLDHINNLTVNQREILVELLTTQTSQEIVLFEIEKRIENDPECPHCQSQHIQRWGSTDNLQRYRCCACTKTFTGLTGSPLARLRYKDKWLAYMSSMILGESIRKAAKGCDIHRTTSFRWRHRFLAMPQNQKDDLFQGIVEADETYFLESFKGSRHLPRAPRKRGGKAKKRGLSLEQIPVMIVRDRYGATTDSVLRRVTEETVGAVLKPVLAEDALLCTDGSTAYKALAKSEGIEHHPLIASQGERVKEKVFHIQNVNAYDSRLKGWMMRFRGVATKYLSNYLGWRRLLEKQGAGLSPQSYLVAAIG
jgi:transposase-like protein